MGPLIVRLVQAILLLLVVRAVVRLLGGIVQGVTARPGPKPGPPAAREVMVRDPVCGTFVLPSRSPVVKNARGVHHFCSDACREAWLTGPSAVQAGGKK